MLSYDDVPLQDIDVVESAIIAYLKSNPKERDLQDFKDYGSPYVNGRITMPDGQRIHQRNFHQAIWSLIRKGLLYHDKTWGKSEFWSLHLTARGMAAAQEMEFSPYKTDKYIQSLLNRTPNMSAAVQQYAFEALKSFQSGCYLACAVMVGVASESAFFEMMDSFQTHWLQGTFQAEFARKLRSKRQYNEKFQLFRITVDQFKGQIDKSLWDNMEIAFNSLLDIFRLYRNDAGHAIGKPISPSDADLIFHLFPKYIEKLYDFKEFFDINTQAV